jgi:hypothetical protein
MAITHKAGNATLEVNGRIDSAGANAVNTGNLSCNASTISLGGNAAINFGGNAADFGTANLTANEAVDFGTENLNGNASTISFNNANSLTRITVPNGTSATISGNISLENGIQLELMPHSTIRIAANGVTFSTGAETVIYTHSGGISISSRNNPLTYENTCREGNTLADYHYHNDDTDPSGVGMLVIGNSLNLVDSIEG